MSSSPAVQNKYIPELTGLRALAAYLVYLHHFPPLQAGLGYAFLRELHVGVSIFFVLSGYLIALRYYGQFEFTLANCVRYSVNRFARIYPMYFLLTLIAFEVAASTRDFSTVGGGIDRPGDWKLVLLANLTFARGFFEKLKFTGVAPGWSLTVEECFYLWAPISFLLIRRWRVLWSQSLTFLVIGVCLVHYCKTLVDNEWGFFNNYTFLLSYTFLGRSFEFFAGIWLAVYYAVGPKVGYPRAAIKTGLGVFGIVFCVATIATSNTHHGLPFSFLSIAMNNWILPWFVVLLIAGLITEESVLARTLRHRWAILLGKGSYVFYLCHAGNLHQLLSITFQGVDNPCFSYVLVFAATNLFSVLAFRYLEEPLNKVIRASADRITAVRSAKKNSEGV